MKLRFITDFARNWKAGDIVEAEYLSDSEILVGNVARIDATLLMKHCEVVTETESQGISNRENHSTKCHDICTDLCKDTDNLLKALEQDPILEKINKMKSEIADSLEFWDYSPNNNPLARDMLETLTKFFGDIKTESEDKNEPG